VQSFSRAIKVIFFVLALTAVECDAQVLATYSTRHEGQDIEISIERTSSHSYLAEYDRSLKLLINGTEKAALKMSPDTAGTVLVNTRYDSDTQSVFLKDRIGCYVIDLSKGLISQRCLPEAAQWSFVGAFDESKERHWKFFPVSERSERTIPTDEK
jgi:hypothetical protein